MTQQSQRIKTNIKFKQNEKGVFYGFVTKNQKGSWRGCNEEDDVRKKIVFVDKHDDKDMIPNTLYQVSLIPMTSDHGFIALNPKLVQFVAKIETEADNNKYRVTVKFGNKIIIYDPTSPNKKKNDIQTIVNLLKSRADLKYKEAVTEEFLDCACLLLSIYKRENKNSYVHTEYDKH